MSKLFPSQSISVDRCDRTCACRKYKIPSTNEELPVPISLSAVQSHMPNTNFVVVTATLVIVTFRFYSSAFSCFILHEAFDMLQQQATAYFGYINLGSHVPFQTRKSNRSCIDALAPISSGHGLPSLLVARLVDVPSSVDLEWPSTLNASSQLSHQSQWHSNHCQCVPSLLNGRYIYTLFYTTDDLVTNIDKCFSTAKSCRPFLTLGGGAVVEHSIPLEISLALGSS